MKQFREKLFSTTLENFESNALALFRFQYKECDVYRNYSNLLRRNPKNVSTLKKIPFLPIELHKNHAVKSGKWKEQKIFRSSGTTNTNRSVRYVSDLDFYLKVTQKIFTLQYGSLKEFQILALVPSYQEQGDSSLLEMVNSFMKCSKPSSTYHLNNDQALINKLKSSSVPTLLIGVSYALLDLAEKYPTPLENVIVMETGGMKGRRSEIIREDLHERLKEAFQQKTIHSEYGMTELYSQAYGQDGKFRFPPWAKVIIRDVHDPFSRLEDGRTGGINIIDLANIDSCAFIETKDLGKQKKDTFEVVGRYDYSDVRGCTLLI